MLKKEWRLRRNREFAGVYRSGQAVPGKYLVLVKKKTASGKPRFGFSVSKKVGKAVTRNRVKRMLGEVLRARVYRIEESVDIVFIARGNIGDCSYQEVEKDVDKLLKRAGLMNC